MNNRAEELEIAIKSASLQISPDAYMMWKDNIVTKRFLAEAELELLDRRADVPHGTTCEAIALAHVKNSSACEQLEVVLAWKPDELQIED